MDGDINTFRVHTQGVHHTNSSWRLPGQRRHTAGVTGKLKPRRVVASKKTAEAIRAGGRIRDARDKLGLSLDRLESLMGGKLSASRIGNYEQGLREVGIAEAKILSPVLQQPAAYLMGLVDEDDRDLLMLAAAVKRGLLDAFRSTQGMGAQKQISGDRPKETHILPAPLQRGRGA
jgi:transcriptional regulator with XRE-family HTH domain